MYVWRVPRTTGAVRRTFHLDDRPRPTDKTTNNSSPEQGHLALATRRGVAMRERRNQITRARCRRREMHTRSSSSRSFLSWQSKPLTTARIPQQSEWSNYYFRSISGGCLYYSSLRIDLHAAPSLYLTACASSTAQIRNQTASQAAPCRVARRVASRDVSLADAATISFSGDADK